MKSFKFAAALLAATTALSVLGTPLPAQDLAASTAARPWMDATLSPDRRAALLLAQMTLDEKIAMLHGPMAMPMGPGPLPKGAVGSAGYIPGNARLGIPALQESDASLGVTNPMIVRGPADVSTPLPSSLLLAATFDPDMAFAGGAMIGTEARAKGLNVLLAGGANLARDPRNGRNFEYAGEDPLLAGTMAGEAIRGVQSTGTISTLKHFALNGQEHLRMTADSRISEGAMRESDLLAFQIAVERGKPGSVMCSYNLVNGTYACQNRHLLTDILKHDWGYPGWVMSDWGAVHTVDAAVAGLDQQSGEQLDRQVWFDAPLKAALAAGTVNVARVDDMTRRILREMFAHGLFEARPAPAKIDFAAHIKIAQAQAEGGIVLLENPRGLLPLAASAQRIAVIGGHADAGVASGSGSSQVTTPYKTGFMPVRSVPVGGEGMMALWMNTVFHPGAPLAAIRQRMKGKTVSFDTGAYPETAAASAKAADVAIVFVYQPSSEGEDVPSMALPFGQDALVEAVAAANPNTIVVVESGNPVLMPWAGKVGAVVESWYAGAGGAEAIARVLFGEVNPSGRLPISWPANESQLPRLQIPGRDAPANTIVKVDYDIEGSDVGYRWYARRKTAPRYWFGAGLSYTSFDYRALAVRGSTTVTASVDVTNTGKVAGKTVAQLYLTTTPGSADVRRLIGFSKIELKPGETRRVAFKADPRLLARFDERAKRWRIGAGRYQVGVGADAGTMALTREIDLAGSTLKP